MRAAGCLFSLLVLGGSCASEPPTVLQSLSVGAMTVQVPRGARLRGVGDDGARVARVSWGSESAAQTRCGERAELEIRFGPSLLPAGFYSCGLHDAFAGGSSHDACPVDHVCVAARPDAHMVCVSPDTACLAVARAFAAR